MNQKAKNQVKGTLIVPLGLAVVFVPFSLLIGWNLLTLLLFWLALTPGLAMYLPKLVSGNTNHLFESIVGMLIFYALMVFMIYDHYQTDYFQLMIGSCVINLGLVSAINWAKKVEAQRQAQAE